MDFRKGSIPILLTTLSLIVQIMSNMSILQAGDERPQMAEDRGIPMAPNTAVALLDRRDHINLLIQKFLPILQELVSATTVQDKINYLSKLPQVIAFLQNHPFVLETMSTMDAEEKLAFLELFAVEQGDGLFTGLQSVVDKLGSLRGLGKRLVEINRFYQCLGGIVGYHVKVLELIVSSIAPQDGESSFYAPPYRDIRSASSMVNKKIIDGIRAQEFMGEIYPVGGAGDRLDLHDEIRGIPLPAARLSFLGNTLLHVLVRDMQAREYLFYKIYGKQITTPVLLMTSEEKDNDREIESILKEAKWFLRPKESFRRIVQPQTPVVTVDGNWVTTAPLKLFMKPGGHGVIWKLADDTGAFTWLKKQGRESILVRQINNPLAGLDYGLIVPIGIGWSEKKAFGFASCPRKTSVAEGVNVLMESKDTSGFVTAITNIEYTEFAKHAKGLRQELPANTNILFANIDAIAGALKTMPIPGMIVNMKNEVTVQRDSQQITLPGARLESTMQNIADGITERFPVSYAEHKHETVRTFVTMNRREKTISVTKKSYAGKGATIAETPEGAFYDLMQENGRLLSECRFARPLLNSESDFLANGPSYLFLYHPALGPLYSVISQKIRGGSLAENAELQLEIAEVDIEDLHVDGSLLVLSKQPLGKCDDSGVLNFSPKSGRCRLHRVKVTNEGIDREANNSFWKNAIVRKEAVKILLEGNSEFEAVDISFQGPVEIRVPDGKRAVVSQRDDGSVDVIFQEIKEPSWEWNYSVNDRKEILLTPKSR